MEVSKVIPISFEKITDYKVEDTRFTKVKIYVLHTGLNLNNSVFEKESVEAAIPSIYNTSILGFIEENSNGDEDFSDHRISLSIEKGKIKSTYKGSAYGVIPESCNPRWEKKVCDDGVEREFLCVDGLLWNKFEASKDIYDRDLFKDQSMELADNYEGHFDKDGHFVFSKFFFDGCCALSNGVLPAMTGASINVNFSVDEIQAKLEQFNRYFSQGNPTPVENIKEPKQEGGNILKKELIDSLLSEFSVAQESLDFEITETMTEDELRTALQAFSDKSKSTKLSGEAIQAILTEFAVRKDELGEFADNISETDFRELVKTFSENKTPVPQAEPVVVFSTYKEKRELLQNVLPHDEKRDADGNLESFTNYYLDDFDDTYAYVEEETHISGNWSCKKKRAKYSIAENVVTLGEFEDMLVKWVTPAEAAAVEKSRISFEASAAEFERLKTFEATTLKEQRDSKVAEIFSAFDEKLAAVDGYTELKKNCADLSIDDIEIRCFALVGKISTNFSAPKSNVIKLGIEKPEPDLMDDGYGGILASKYTK